MLLPSSDSKTTFTTDCETDYCSRAWDEKIQENTPRKILILDTSAFLAGLDPFSVNEEQVTVPEVEEEIRTNTITWVRFKAAAENGKLIIKQPSEESLKRVEACATAVGDTFFLSETDKQLLALGVELKASAGTTQIGTAGYS